MADESIINYRRPGFPRVQKGERGTITTIEYIGPTATLEAATPDRNSAWGEYSGTVKDTDIEPVELTSYSVLIVVMESIYDVSGGGGEGEAGTPGAITYEVEWTMFDRSIFEHPEVAVGLGGTRELTSEDIAAIEKWQNTEDVTEKKDFKYKKSPDDAAYVELSANAKYVARGIQLGQEKFEDYAPVVRVTTEYFDGLPELPIAGMKDNPPSFIGGPPGYEWRKTADRAISGEVETKWNRVEEWIGAKKILSDKDSLYWEAP
jgi:hypothetical protein